MNLVAPPSSPDSPAAWHRKPSTSGTPNTRGLCRWSERARLPVPVRAVRAHRWSRSLPLRWLHLRPLPGRLVTYYEDELVTLHHGRCEDVMAVMPDNSVDIVVTSPPYNMGLVPGGNGRGMYRPGASNKAGRFRDGYGAHDDAMDQDAYDDWQRKVLAECWRVARLAVFYNHRPRVEHGVLRDPLGNDFGIPLRQRIIWNRGTGIDVTCGRSAPAASTCFCSPSQSSL